MVKKSVKALKEDYDVKEMINIIRSRINKELKLGNYEIVRQLTDKIVLLGDIIQNKEHDDFHSIYKKFVRDLKKICPDILDEKEKRNTSPRKTPKKKSPRVKTTTTKRGRKQAGENIVKSDESLPDIFPTKSDPYADCLATIKKPNAPGQKIIKDGKEYTIAKLTEWGTKKRENIFVDDYKLVKSEKLNYPEPIDRRDPVEKINKECNKCRKVFSIYPSEIFDNEMIWRCNKCNTR